MHIHSLIRQQARSHDPQRKVEKIGGLSISTTEEVKARRVSSGNEYIETYLTSALAAQLYKASHALTLSEATSWARDAADSVVFLVNTMHDFKDYAFDDVLDACETHRRQCIEAKKRLAVRDPSLTMSMVRSTVAKETKKATAAPTSTDPPPSSSHSSSLPLTSPPSAASRRGRDRDRRSKSRDRRPPPTPSGEICRGFNSANGCKLTAQACRHEHKCSKCGSIAHGSAANKC